MSKPTVQIAISSRLPHAYPGTIIAIGGHWGRHSHFMRFVWWFAGPWGKPLPPQFRRITAISDDGLTLEVETR